MPLLEVEIITLDKLIEKDKQAKRDSEENGERYNFLWGFIGTNRTGKSVIANNYAQDWKATRPEGTVVSFDPQKRFQDVSDWYIEAEDEDWALKLLELRDALIIIDDYKIINEKNTPVKGLGKLMMYRSDYNLDIIYICHNPSLVLNLFTYFTTHYFLFYTEAMDGSFQKKINNYRLCIAGQKLINKYVKAYGRGKYPHFPHVVVDTENTELNAMNFTKTIL